jgi:F-type H+-transporting ATPase subunit epsilon
MAQQSKTLKVSVVSAEAEIFSGDAHTVELPGEVGSLGILPGHTPLITRIRAGTVWIKTASGTEEFIFVAGGILEVQPDEVTVLADTAIRGQDLDEAKAQQARQQAETALQNTQSKLEYATVAAELETTIAQLAAIRQLRRTQVRH